MSKSVDFSPLEEYSDEQVKLFNETIEKFLKDDSVVDELKKSVAYFYLLAHKLEEGYGFYAWLYHDDITSLEGKVLTLLDGVLPNGKQCDASKALFRQMLWNQWVETLKRTCPEIPVGTPDYNNR